MNGALAFDRPLGSWETGRVIHLQYAFSNCRRFNQPLES
jgi:hypothetical protein